MVAEAAGGAGRVDAPERGQSPGGDGARPLKRVAGVEVAEHGVDDRGVHAPGPKLCPQARGAVAAGRASRDPLVCKGRVVEMSPAEEVGHHVRGDVRRRAATLQPARQLRAGPGPPRQQVRGDQPGPTGIERLLRYPYRRVDEVAVSSPVEKMPRTLRSKSSGLEAVSLAVS